MLLTVESLKRFAPRAKPEVLKALVGGSSCLAQAGITTPLRLRHALAQWCYETDGFTEWSENLHYSAKRLREVFPRYFTSAQALAAAAAGPKAIANHVYDDRNPARINKLGNIHNGDGWKYRGRGVMHTTGLWGYQRASVVTGKDLVAEPDLLADPALSLIVAADYWARRGCNKHADRNNLEGVTRIINGGHNGLEGRREYLRRAEKIWPDGVLDPAPVAASVIQEGSRGADVMAVQKRLAELGYPAAADGVYGPLMRRAVLAFKSDNGLQFNDETADDIDVATLAALHDPATHPADVGQARLETPHEVAAAAGGAQAVSMISAVGKVIAGGGAATYIGLQDAVSGNLPAMLTSVQDWASKITAGAALLKAAPWVGLVILGIVIWRLAEAVRAERAAQAAKGGH